jgi:hypothetical protein
MAELTRQNLELWSRVQEGMLAAFTTGRPTSGDNQD